MSLNGTWTSDTKEGKLFPIHKFSKATLLS